MRYPTCHKQNTRGRIVERLDRAGLHDRLAQVVQVVVERHADADGLGFGRLVAGLPGAGKSTIAVRLEQELGAVIFDKDRVRTVLFPPRVLDYSAEQDDICMTAIYQAAGAVILSGLEDGFWGGRIYRTEDLEGHHWLFSQAGVDLDAAHWSPPPGVRRGV